MDNKIIGRFIPVGKYNDWAKPFFVLTKEPSDYLAPAWKGIMPTGEEYHVIESAWKFEPIEWDGEGLPPVGTGVEVSVDGGRTWCTYKAISEHDGMRLVEIGNFTEEFQSNNWTFRPIRSEADKKKESAIFAIAELCRGSASNGHSAELIYDAIKSGKIVID